MDASQPSARSTLQDYLSANVSQAPLSKLLLVIAEACAEISALVRRGSLGGALGEAGGENVQGETQKKLDVISNDILIAAAERSGEVAAGASEELEEIFVLSKDASYLLLFDPLDGSSNIDVNMPIGTILSVLSRSRTGVEASALEFMQKGRAQTAAAYAIYGPQTTLALTLGQGVVGFTLDPQNGEWVLTDPNYKIATAANEFAINMSNQRHWAPAVQTYVEECLQGKAGVRGKDFNMRWVGAMVADVHRILQRGGVFLYPWDKREPHRAGKLRLMYEANPLGLIIEQAGGKISDGLRPILDIEPEGLHQRVSVILGAAEEVDRVVSLHHAKA